MSAEFQAIISMLETAGEGAKDAFILYLVFRVAMLVIGFVGFAVIMKLVIKSIQAIATSVSTKSHIIRIIRDKMGIGNPGRLIEEEVDEVWRKLHKLFAIIEKDDQ